MNTAVVLIEIPADRDAASVVGGINRADLHAVGIARASFVADGSTDPADIAAAIGEAVAAWNPAPANADLGTLSEREMALIREFRRQA